MPWRDRFRHSEHKSKSTAPAIKRTPFVLVERRNLSPASSALLAQIARRYTVIPVPNSQRHSFRVGVSDVEAGRDPAQHLAAALTELDPEWEEHFTRPVPIPGRD